ncbi:queuosine precursor transporter [Fulvivirgaceae bacterium BMA10]|uniref:Probable queuosine precursor transporter n=1 Tax=Splendidivirga corallicola TaxID=3051826 RepID=A0ABT8KH06_9BACT|nr:queuosine precursor transporter [Fulvivirgaceae bacterium BMA10]
MDASLATRKKKTNLFIILSGIFLTNAIIAELIGVKIFSFETSLGFQPANIKLFGGNILDFNLTAGVVLWPVVFITTDIINEYFGKKGVRKISFLTVGLIAYGFLVIYLATLLEPAQFWLDIHKTDALGNAFNIDYAFSKIFQQGTRIIFASLVAFLVGQFLDVFIFQRLRRVTGSKMIWLRATGSTLVSQLIDSYVVLFLAFYLLAPADTRWPVAQVISVGIINYIYKFVIAIVLTPLLYVAHYFIDNYLGKTTANEMMKEAADSSRSFF